jgi:integrase
MAQYEWAATIAEARWGGWPATKLTSQLLEAAYVDMLATGRRQYRTDRGTEVTGSPLSPRSIEAFHKVTKAAFAEAVKRGRLASNPADLATPPTVSDQLRPYWTPDPVGRFLDFINNGCRCVVEGLAELLVDSGGRRGEVLGLHWDDLDLEDGTACLWRQLSSDPRTRAISMRSTKRPRSKSVIALHPDTVAALRRRQVLQKRDRLRMGAGWPEAGSLEDG